MFYINENIPYEKVYVEGPPMTVKSLLIELFMKNRKWLCIVLYKPPSKNEKYFFENISLVLTKMSWEYENLTI